MITVQPRIFAGRRRWDVDRDVWSIDRHGDKDWRVETVSSHATEAEAERAAQQLREQS